MSLWAEIVMKAKAGKISRENARLLLREGPGRKLLSSAEVAKELGLNLLVVQRDLKKGKLRADRVGKTYVIAAEATLDYYLNKQFGGGRPKGHKISKKQG